MGKQWKFLTRAFSELPCSLELSLPIPCSSLAPIMDPNWHLGLYALLTSTSSHLCPPWTFLTTVAVYSQLVSNSVTPWAAAHQASLPFTVSWNLLKLMSIKAVMPSNRLILCHPLLLLPSVFSNESFLSFTGDQSIGDSASISPPNEYSRLISFRIDLFAVLAVQGTLKNLLQHHSSKASIHQCSAFFMVQFSHPYMTTRKNLAFTTQIFVGKVISLFNMLSRLVIAFLPRCKHCLISWLQSPSAVILEPKKIKSVTVSIVFPIYLPWSDGTRCHDFHLLNVEF